MSTDKNTKKGFLHSHGQRLLDLGYNILPIAPGSKACFDQGWQTRVSNQELLDSWLEHKEQLSGVGVLTAYNPAVDIDVRDANMAVKMVDYTSVQLGHTAQRVGQAPKVLLPYRTLEPFDKITSKSYVSPDGKKHKVEILGNGQQFVAYHTHPDTRQPYYYDDDYHELVEIPAVELPLITKQQAQQVIDYFEANVPADWVVEQPASDYTEAPPDDEVTTALRDRGLIKQWDSRNGGYKVTCPWVCLHTDQKDDGAIYFVPSEDNSFRGGYMCHHAHCSHQGIKALHRELQLGQSSRDISIGVVNSVEELFEAFIVTEEDVRDIQNAEFLVDDFIIRGHMIAIVAEPNAGKTAIMMHLSKVLAEQGMKVLYFNLDAPAPEIHRHFNLATQAGYTLISPDIKKGVSIDDAVEKLGAMAAMEADLRNYVLVLDTLKKCVEVINKNLSKDFYKILRKLTAQGVTVVMLGHANKYRDKEGNLIYEGTGDLRADSDELIYLEFIKKPLSQIVSTYPDKVRGHLTNISFSIDNQSREVSFLPEFDDVKEKQIIKKKAEKTDKPGLHGLVIRAIVKERLTTETLIVDYVKTCAHHGIHSIRAFLKLYSNPDNPSAFLHRERAVKCNAWIYSVLQ